LRILRDLRRIDGGEGIQFDSLSEAGQVVTLRPRDQWPAGALLEVEVSTYVTDLADRQIVSPYFARFSIAN
jgi:hypothetical protein